MKTKELGLEYWNQLSINERSIYEKMDKYSDFFSDMLFKPNSSTYEFIFVQNGFSVIPDYIDCFSYDYFKVKVKRLNDCNGAFSCRTQTLYIDLKSIEDDSVLLHEMIHLHEYVITDKQPKMFYDAVLWGLYISLKDKIPNLNSIITSNIHILDATDIYNIGGNHSLLFMLKSFDLDLKMNYPLGTVYGYDLAERLKA